MTGPSFSNHWIPKTTSKPCNGREYRVVENWNCCIEMGTSSYLSLHCNFSLFATLTLNSSISVTTSRSDGTTNWSTKLWVDPLSINITKVLQLIVALIRMVLRPLQPVITWSEIRGSTSSILCFPSTILVSPSSNSSYFSSGA